MRLFGVVHLQHRVQDLFVNLRAASCLDFTCNRPNSGACHSRYCYSEAEIVPQVKLCTRALVLDFGHKHDRETEGSQSMQRCCFRRKLLQETEQRRTVCDNLRNPKIQLRLTHKYPTTQTETDTGRRGTGGAHAILQNLRTKLAEMI